MKLSTFMSIIQEIRSLANGSYNDRQASITLKNILLAEYGNSPILSNAFDHATNIDDFEQFWHDYNDFWSKPATDVPPTDSELINGAEIETADETKVTTKKKNTKK